MFVLLLIFIPITGLSLMSELNMSFGLGFRHAVFNIASALSTTGYSTMSYTAWPPLSLGVLILVMLIGGGIGSTAGGIKMTRVYLLMRVTIQNIRKRLQPSRSVESIYFYRAQGKTTIENSYAIDTTGFVMCYLGLFIAGALLLTVTAKCSLTEALFEFASALGTVGLSIGITNRQQIHQHYS
jgi:trk system potassium uptake protein TrkH